MTRDQGVGQFSIDYKIIEIKNQKNSEKINQLL